MKHIASFFTMHTKSIILRDLAHISAGHPIRDAVRNVPGGDVAVVQIKNVDAETGIDWPAVARTKLTGRREPDWLKPGDILFAARGQRNIAVHVSEPPAKAVCSPHFFLIRIKNEQEALPEFVAWQMNLPKSQNYLASSATGSFITSIRRQVLETVPLRLPSMEHQKLLANLGQAAVREKELIKRMIENRKQQLNAIAKELLA
jgi:hypothetical protein